MCLDPRVVSSFILAEDVEALGPPNPAKEALPETIACSPRNPVVISENYEEKPTTGLLKLCD